MGARGLSVLDQEIHYIYQTMLPYIFNSRLKHAKMNSNQTHVVIGSIMPTLLGNIDGIQNTSENEAKQQPRKSLEHLIRSLKYQMKSLKTKIDASMGLLDYLRRRWQRIPT